MIKPNRLWKPALFILILIFAACTIQRNPVTGNKRAYGFSWKQGKQLGAKESKQVAAQYGILQNKDIQNYVDMVAQDVLNHSDLRGKGTQKKYLDTQIHYQVLDNPAVNAFTLPGGYIYVDRGLLTHVQNEAQLAMVIGHETGHAAARHSAQQAFNQKIGKFALLGGAIAGQAAGINGGNILRLGGAAEQALFLKYSRDDEREADRLGVEYSAKSGYKAADGAGFFGALKRQSEKAGRSLPEWQQTHPDPGERINNIQREAKKWEQKGYAEKEEHQNRYMKAIDNLVYGDNPRHGFSRNGMFYQPDLKFKFPVPQNWQVMNQANAVIMVNSDQNAIIEFQIDSKNDSPRASVNEFLNQKGINPGQGHALNKNSLTGYEATATGQSQQGAKLGFYLYSVQFDSKIYRFISYTTAQQYSKYRSVFQQVSNGFDRLSDRSILNIKPVRLHVYQANRTAKFSSFLPNNMPMDIKPQDVAIANQVELNDTIQKGTWIKIPRQ